MLSSKLSGVSTPTQPFHRTSVLRQERRSALVLSGVDEIATLPFTSGRNYRCRKINGRDFLIVGIPQMDLTPVARYAIPSSYNQRQRDAALSRLQALTNQYNSALSSFAQSFKSEVSGGQVYYFDLANLVRSEVGSRSGRT